MSSEETNTPNVGTQPQAQPQTRAQMNQAAEDRMSRRRLGYSHTEYFKDNLDKEVWVQNISDKQISMEIETGLGQTQPKLIPPVPHPVMLTEEFTYEQLKKSGNFKKTLAKRDKQTNRPLLILVDAQQVEAYYAAFAKQNGAVYPDGAPDIEAAMTHAAEVHRQMTTKQVGGEEVNASNLHGFAPPKSAQELIAMDLSNRGIVDTGGSLQVQRAQAGMPANMMMQGGVLMEEVVNPKVLHLCQQVSAQIPESAKMPAEQLLPALQSMQATLRIEDYQHIEAFGHWRTIKRWARQKISEMASGDEGAPDALSMAGQGQIAQAQRQGALQVVPMPQGFGPQGPASLAQQGMQYQGPTGFANAPWREAYGAGESMSSVVLGPDGNPLPLG